MNRRIGIILLTGLLLLGGGCGTRKVLPTDPAAGLTVEQPEVVPGRHKKQKAPATIIGKTPDGALYALYRPQGWNGDLVLYAHGYIAPGMPIALPTADFIEPFRDGLLARGYAVAYSSYAENGLAVADGIEHTHELNQRFRSRLGKPRRTFLAGHSLGGLIVLALAERYGGRYDGALVMSGVLGGTRAEIDYISHVRVLFDYFYPGVLPGDLLHLPRGVDLHRDVIGPAVAAIQANPNGAAAMSQITQTPIPFSNPEELVESIVRALTFQVVELEDLLQRTRGESFFDNAKTVYDGPLPTSLLADLNARVARYKRSQRVEALFDRAYEPTGELEIPLLTLYNMRDPVVPGFHESLYRDRVTKEGELDLLVQRPIDRYGHVGFPPGQMLGAFEELVEWSRGKKDDGKKLLVLQE